MEQQNNIKIYHTLVTNHITTVDRCCYRY